MVRAMFVEYPDDPGCWQVEDQYLFGSDILVAPLIEEDESNVYLPPGQWIDYQTGKVYQGGWHAIKAGNIPIVMLVKDGTALPHIKLAQSTSQMDWSNIELKVYATDAATATCKLFLPNDPKLYQLELTRKGNAYEVVNNPVSNQTKFHVQLAR